MPMLEAEQFQDAEKYSSYLKTPAGRLRSELAWETLRRFLPGDASRRRVLDLGGGTGSTSVQLARMGFQVSLLDSSQNMLGIASKEAEANGVAARISFHHTEASRLRELFEAESFDFVLCHNVLEYLADPATTVAEIARVLRQDAVTSILVRNRAGEVFRAAIKLGDWALAKSNLSAETVVDSLYGKPVRVFDPKEVLDMLDGAGLRAVGQYGVRVFSDYRGSNDPTGKADYQQLLELELILGAQPKFAAIARYTHLIARRSSAYRRNRSE